MHSTGILRKHTYLQQQEVFIVIRTVAFDQILTINFFINVPIANTEIASNCLFTVTEEMGSDKNAILVGLGYDFTQIK